MILWGKGYSDFFTSNECNAGAEDSDIITSIIHLSQVSNIKMLI